MPRFRLCIAYDGAGFDGWQLQPGRRTVQGEMERALERIIGAGTRVHASGRTDAGVHALGQVAHFDAPDDLAHVPWDKALNALLTPEVRVTAFASAAPDFHARFHARAKTYAYTLAPVRHLADPRRRHYVWPCGPIDETLMDRVAPLFVGEHDFRAFQNTGTDVKTTVREVLAFARMPGPYPGESVWRITATGFLKQMVRNIMGCLVEAGRGKVDERTIRFLLDEGARSDAPATAPPQGLCLERVDYAPAHGPGDADDEHQMDTDV